MFGFSLIKILFTAAVVYAVWKAFQHFARLQKSREASARTFDANAHPKATKTAKSPPPQDGVEDMVECPVCKAYVTRGAKSCGRTDCPFMG